MRIVQVSATCTAHALRFDEIARSIDCIRARTSASASGLKAQQGFRRRQDLNSHLFSFNLLFPNTCPSCNVSSSYADAVMYSPMAKTKSHLQKARDLIYCGGKHTPNGHI